LTVEGLNAIHSGLKLAGVGDDISLLHQQIMLNYTMVITEDLEVHLVSNHTMTFIKPLPRFLISEEFWRIILCGGNNEHDRLQHLAYGFLKSDSQLVCHCSDFKITKDLDLIPDENLQFDD